MTKLLKNTREIFLAIFALAVIVVVFALPALIIHALVRVTRATGAALRELWPEAYSFIREIINVAIDDVKTRQLKPSVSRQLSEGLAAGPLALYAHSRVLQSPRVKSWSDLYKECGVEADASEAPFDTEDAWQAASEKHAARVEELRACRRLAENDRERARWQQVIDDEFKAWTKTTKRGWKIKSRRARAGA